MHPCSRTVRTSASLCAVPPLNTATAHPPVPCNVQIHSYDYRSGSYSSSTGHATQMLWATSQQLGCATASSAQGCWQRTVYVCQYSPPGGCACACVHLDDSAVPSCPLPPSKGGGDAGEAYKQAV